MARLKEVSVRFGDSLQRLAARELQDAARWRELVAINGLVPPYLLPTAEASERRANVLLWGDPVLVPAVAINDSAAVGDNAFGQDVRVGLSGRLTAADGDLALIAGAANLAQALRHRVLVPLGSYLPHADYGCEIHALLGLGNGPVVALVGAAMVRRAVVLDPRCQAAVAAGVVDRDQLRVSVSAQTVDAERVTDFNVLYQLPVT